MPRVLIVEDEPAIGESLAFALKRDGFEVDRADTFAEAEKALDGHDIAIVDLMLPDGSGFDLIGQARRTRPPVPLIVLSSRDAETDRVAALEMGADDYVTKPFSPREMVARVRAVLRRAGRAEAASSDEPCPVTVDAETRRALVLGKPVDLTRVEFDLLSCLLTQPGKVFTRSELIDTVWGSGFAITDRTVDSHVKTLRRKVADGGGSQSLIETVRGVGYRIVERIADEGG